MSSPPITRSRSAGGGADIDAIVEAVLTRLTAAGLAVGGAPSAPVSALEQDVKPVVTEETGPSATQRELWMEELREQHTSSLRFGLREKEEVKALLIIGEGGGPPLAHRLWYWGRVRLFLIVAHHGWGAAVADAQHSDMERLGIRLSPAAPPPTAAPTPSEGTGRRSGPSRPSGLRPPPRRSTAPAAPRH